MGRIQAFKNFAWTVKIVEVSENNTEEPRFQNSHLIWSSPNVEICNASGPIRRQVNWVQSIEWGKERKGTYKEITMVVTLLCAHDHLRLVEPSLPCSFDEVLR